MYLCMYLCIYVCMCVCNSHYSTYHIQHFLSPYSSTLCDFRHHLLHSFVTTPYPYPLQHPPFPFIFLTFTLTPSLPSPPRPPCPRLSPFPTSIYTQSDIFSTCSKKKRKQKNGKPISQRAG